MARVHGEQPQGVGRAHARTTRRLAVRGTHPRAKFAQQNKKSNVSNAGRQGRPALLCDLGGEYLVESEVLTPQTMPSIRMSFR